MPSQYWLGATEIGAGIVTSLELLSRLPSRFPELFMDMSEAAIAFASGANDAAAQMPTWARILRADRSAGGVARARL